MTWASRSIVTPSAAGTGSCARRARACRSPRCTGTAAAVSGPQLDPAIAASDRGRHLTERLAARGRLAQAAAAAARPPRSGPASPHAATVSQTPANRIASQRHEARRRGDAQPPSPARRARAARSAASRPTPFTAAARPDPAWPSRAASRGTCPGRRPSSGAGQHHDGERRHHDAVRGVEAPPATAARSRRPERDRPQHLAVGGERGAAARPPGPPGAGSGPSPTQLVRVVEGGPRLDG